jgi:cytochrome c oxidase cbb3-type subunit 2
MRARFALAAPLAALALLPAAAAGKQKRPFTAAFAAAGRPLYLAECSACHGEAGDGQGPAAEFLEIKPRDFTRKVFKLRTTPTGEPPATADILRTIERGIPGTAMPSFRFLSEEDRAKIAAQVLFFADLLDGDEPEPIAVGEPPPPSPALVARGAEVFALMRCASCHGEKGKGDGVSAKTLKDDDRRPIKVRDFTGGVFRGGGERRDLYHRFSTGMDGTPMPSYADSMVDADRWALAEHVMSLRVTPPLKPLPRDPLAAGREVTAKYHCRGCHVLDDGKGGSVGPDLRVSGQKLGTDFVTRFVQNPRAYGKVYPWRPNRMPLLGLGPEEAEAIGNYLAAMGKRRAGPVAIPDPASFTQKQLEEGRSVFSARCAECHTLGNVVPTPLPKQQGPDLLNVAGRVDFDWARRWIVDSKRIDPTTKMTVPGITPEQVEAVRRFVWKTSIEHGGNAAVWAPAPAPASR